MGWAACLAALGPGVAAGAQGPLPGGDTVPTRLRVEPRRALPVVVLSPTGAPGAIRLADLHAAFARPIDELTAFDPVFASDDAVRACRAQLVCIVRRVRPDYDRDDLRRTDARLEPYAVHRARVRSAGLRPARFVLVVTHVTVPSRPDRVLALLVDTDEALRLLHEVERSEGWRERVEEQVLRRAVRAEAELQATETAADVERFADVFFGSRVAPIFDAEGAWRPFAEVTLRSVPIGSEIIVDGEVLGVAASRVVVVDDLGPGPHEIAIRHPEHEPFETSVRADAKTVTALDVELRPRRGEPFTPRTVITIAGAAAVIAGAAVLTVAAVQSTDATTFCFEGPGCEASARFDPARGPPEPGVGASPSGGVLLAPLGLGLIATGATWSAGAGLVERRPMPWISTLAGLALGGLVYGTAAAVSD
jgi:hypothetical protein